MGSRTIGLALTIGLGAGAVSLGAAGGEFPQWRGPLRNGIVPQSAPLDVAWPAAGPANPRAQRTPRGRRLWVGRRPRAVARNVFWNRRYRVPLATRTLDDEGSGILGAMASDRATRSSSCDKRRAWGEDIRKARRDERNAWGRSWIEARNLPRPG